MYSKIFPPKEQPGKTDNQATSISNRDNKSLSDNTDNYYLRVTNKIKFRNMLFVFIPKSQSATPQTHLTKIISKNCSNSELYSRGFSSVAIRERHQSLSFSEIT